MTSIIPALTTCSSLEREPLPPTYEIFQSPLPRAPLYDPKSHSLQEGDIELIEEKIYYFPYAQFPHGVLDREVGTRSLDPDLVQKIEQIRKFLFESACEPSRGIGDITMYRMKLLDRFFNLTCTKDGHVLATLIEEPQS